MANQQQDPNEVTEEITNQVTQLGNDLVRVVMDSGSNDGRVVVAALVLAIGRVCGAHGPGNCSHADWVSVMSTGYPMFEIGWEEATSIAKLINECGDH